VHGHRRSAARYGASDVTDLTLYLGWRERIAWKLRQSSSKAPGCFCEEKVTFALKLRSYTVHGGLDHLMEHIVQFTFGGKRASARC
jgi:hypothetical protein